MNNVLKNLPWFTLYQIIRGVSRTFFILRIWVNRKLTGCTEQSHNLVLWQWSSDPSNAIRVIDDFERLRKSKDLWKDDVSNQ
jgi:hypothetical protein